MERASERRAPKSPLRATCLSRPLNPRTQAPGKVHEHRHWRFAITVVLRRARVSRSTPIHFAQRIAAGESERLARKDRRNRRKFAPLIPAIGPHELVFRAALRFGLCHRQRDSLDIRLTVRLEMAPEGRQCGTLNGALGDGTSAALR
jgi:hypothetical protein